MRRLGQAKENRSEDFRDSALILLAVLATFAAVYALLYFAVGEEKEH